MASNQKIMASQVASQMASQFDGPQEDLTFNCTQALDRLENGINRLFDAVDQMQIKLSPLLVCSEFPPTDPNKSDGNSAMSISLVGKAKALEELNRRVIFLLENIDY